MIIHNPILTGSFTVNGADLSTITGSVTTSASFDARTTYLESTSSILTAASASLSVTSGSLVAASASLSAASGSFNSRVSALEATGSALTSSLTTVSSSGYATSASLSAASGSFNSRVNTIESKYATTGSNTFTAPQYVSDTTVPTGFSNTTGSIYTDGGLQVTKDSYFSGSVFIKGNVTVYGTQSVAYITSSQLNIATNIITVNTATPSVRFGGLSVFDSGSTGTGATGSLFWDSQNNNWLYSNPSGSGNYDSAMVIMGPRNSSAIGNEQGLSCNYLVLGHGSHHTTSSMIYHDSSTTCVQTALIGTSTACFAGVVCSNGNVLVGGTGTTNYLPKFTGASTIGNSILYNSGNNIGIGTGGSVYASTTLLLRATSAVGTDNALIIEDFDTNTRLTIKNNGAATFSSSVTAAGALFTAATETRGNIRTTFASDNSYYSLFSNDGALTLDTYGVGGYMNFKILGSTKLTIASTGAATFSSSVTATQYTATSTGGSGLRVYGGSGTNQWDMYLNGANLRFSDNTGTGSFVVDRPATFSSSVTATDLNLNRGAGNWNLIPSSGANYLYFLNTTTSTYELTFDGVNHRVGIGTTSPASKLTIYEGDIRLYKNHVISDTATWLANINFTDEIDRLGARITGERTAWDGAPMGLGFDTGGVGTVTRRMTITSGGNVGIGCTTPNTPLYVVGEITSQNGEIYFKRSTFSEYGHVYMGSDKNFYIRQTAACNISLFTNGSERLRIIGNGEIRAYTTIQNWATPGGDNYTLDTMNAYQSIANGGYVDFNGMSGMILVNNWSNGAMTAFLVGGGNTAVMGTITGTAGTMHHSPNVGGYRWCNNYGSTANFGFQVFRTRNTA